MILESKTIYQHRKRGILKNDLFERKIADVYKKRGSPCGEPLELMG
ncbi:MAG: hypothetical protein ACK46A_09755 [Akkermansiaceae bacterium]